MSELQIPKDELFCNVVNANGGDYYSLMGSIWYVEYLGKTEYYMFAQVSPGKYNMICLSSGNRSNDQAYKTKYHAFDCYQYVQKKSNFSNVTELLYL